MHLQYLQDLFLYLPLSLLYIVLMKFHLSTLYGLCLTNMYKLCLSLAICNCRNLFPTSVTGHCLNNHMIVLTDVDPIRTSYCWGMSFFSVNLTLCACILCGLGLPINLTLCTYVTFWISAHKRVLYVYITKLSFVNFFYPVLILLVFDWCRLQYLYIILLCKK